MVNIKTRLPRPSLEIRDAASSPLILGMVISNTTTSGFKFLDRLNGLRSVAGFTADLPLGS